MIYNVGDPDPTTGNSMFCPPGESVPFEYDVLTGTDYVLAAESADPLVTIWAKANPGDAFQNIVSSPLSLTGFTPARRAFYFELRVDPSFVITDDNEFQFPTIDVRLT